MKYGISLGNTYHIHGLGLMVDSRGEIFKVVHLNYSVFNFLVAFINIVVLCVYKTS